MLGQWPDWNMVVLGGNGFSIAKIYVQGECEMIPKLLDVGMHSGTVKYVCMNMCPK